MPKSILIVDDDAIQREMLQSVLDRVGYKTLTAKDGVEAIEILTAASPRPVDIVLLDLMMEHVGGMEVLRTVHPKRPNLPFIVLTANSSVDKAVEAMQAGATDFIAKPASPDRIKVSVKNALKINTLSGEVTRLSRKQQGPAGFADLIGQSDALQKAVKMAQRGAANNIPILLEGESGVGKEVFARAIQSASDRANKPFVVVNCGAIPDNLVESILFGHEKGAFTGATDKHMGKFVEADGGTLFLDEIGELPLELQVKLLRVLQEGEVDPVGGRDPVKVDVRLISATNRNLQQQAEQGAFREDLFYRLNVFPITLPSLRDRAGDIPLLVNYFIERFALTEGYARKKVSPAAFDLLEAYHWPGNVRQLENAIFRAVILAEGDVISPDDFPQIQSALYGPVVAEKELNGHSVAQDQTNGHINGKTSDQITAQTDGAGIEAVALLDAGGNIRKLSDVEADIIEFALEKYNRHMSEIARRLGIGRSTLYRKIEEIGLLED